MKFKRTFLLAAVAVISVSMLLTACVTTTGIIGPAVNVSKDSMNVLSAQEAGPDKKENISRIIAEIDKLCVTKFQTPNDLTTAVNSLSDLSGLEKLKEYAKKEGDMYAFSAVSELRFLVFASLQDGVKELNENLIKMAATIPAMANDSSTNRNERHNLANFILNNEPAAKQYNKNQSSVCNLKSGEFYGLAALISEFKTKKEKMRGLLALQRMLKISDLAQSFKYAIGGNTWYMIVHCHKFIEAYENKGLDSYYTLMSICRDLRQFAADESDGEVKELAGSIVDIIEAGFKNGCDLAQKSKWDVILTKYMLGGGGKAEVLEAINSGADVNLKTVEGVGYPLALAIIRCDPDVAESLIKNGADVNMNTGLGTPLSLAIHRGALKTAKLLLDHGADVNLKGKDSNEIPLVFLVKKGFPIVTDTKCLDANLDEDRRNSGNASLNLIGNIVEIALMLVDGGADVNAKSLDGTPLLTMAVRNGNVVLMKKLIESKGIDLNAQDSQGETALMDAVRHADSTGSNKYEIEYLIQGGADVGITNNNGQTAMDIAESLGKTEVIEQMKKLAQTPSE